MKSFVFLLVCACTALAADFLTGQAARITIGQTTFTSQDTGNPSAQQLGAVGGLAYANDTLFVVDSSHIQATPVHNRVLIYDNLSQMIPAPTAEIPQGIRCPVCLGSNQNTGATLVLGQPDFTTTNIDTSGPTYAVTAASNAAPVVVSVASTAGLSVGEFVSVVGVTGNTGANGVWQISALDATDLTLQSTTGNGNYTGGGFVAPYSVSPVGMRTPTGVASDGHMLAVADADNNRVLIWKTIPSAMDQPADLVLGQPTFNTALPGTSGTSLRGPEGVWIQGNQFFVADTQNHRVLIWNSIPTASNQPADLVLGEPNLTTAPSVTTSDVPPQANNLYSPVSVSSDGQHLFVADLAHNRVLIWNSIPTQNQQPADVEIGQPDMVSETANNVLSTCVSNGTDSDNNPTYPSGCTTFCPLNGMDSDNNPLYPQRCGRTLNFPRFALSDGQRLFIADGGNDRVLIYNTIPTQNGQPADLILGQPDEWQDQTTDAANVVTADSNILNSSPNTIRTPLSLAWDGVNLYVSDPFDRRVLVFTLGAPIVPITGITNLFSLNVYAVGGLNFSGTITANDTITVTINATAYKYTVIKADTLTTIIQNITALINGGTGGTPDPNVIATVNPSFNQIILTSRIPGPNGNSITYSVTTAAASSSGTPTETVTASGASLAGGQTAAEVAPGTLVKISGTDLSDTTATAVPYANGYYPTSLGGVEVYFDGIRAPLVYVSPTEIHTQIPYEIADSNGISAVVRTVHNDGSVTNANAISIPIVLQNPGILAGPGNDPRPVIAFHTTSNAVAVVDVSGQITGGNTATVNIDQRGYTYTVQAGDSLTTVRDALVVLINADPNSRVTAAPSGEYTRIILTAKVPGPDGNGIAITVSNIAVTSTSPAVALSVLGNAFTCCASVAGTRVTPDNPATPGEIISIYATGLGLATLGDGSTIAGATGQLYQGPAYNFPETLVDNAQVGGKTANVLGAALVPGMLGVFQVQLQLDSSLPTNPNTQMYIAQSFFTSNIVTIPIVSPSQ